MERNKDNDSWEVETHGGKYNTRIEKVNDPRGTYYALFVKGVKPGTNEISESVVPIFPLEFKSLMRWMPLIIKEKL